MCLPDGRLFTTPCGIRTKLSTGRRTPLYLECDSQSKTSISLKTILDKQDEVVSIDVDVFDSAQAQLVSFLFLPFYDNIYNIFTFGFGNFFSKTFETFIISPIPE